jgi:antitoxin ParD1/3/4
MRAPPTRRAPTTRVRWLAVLNGAIDTTQLAPRFSTITRTWEQPMNVSLTPELERWLSEKVDGERYKNVSDVVREGLLLLQAREAEQAARYAALKADIQEALEEVERGELVDGEEAMDRAYALIAQLEENAA